MEQPSATPTTNPTQQTPQSTSSQPQPSTPTIEHQQKQTPKPPTPIPHQQPSPTIPTPAPRPNPQRNPTPPIPVPHSAPQIRPQTQTQTHINRPRQNTPTSSSASPYATYASASPASNRGGLAIGVPAHQARPPTSTPPATTYAAFNASYGQQFGGLGRNPNESGANQVKQGIQTIGMVGSLTGAGAGMRQPGGNGMSQHHQQRGVQQVGIRGQQAVGVSNPGLGNQKYQNHGPLRMPAVGSPGTPSPGTSQSSAAHQPWMAPTNSNQVKQMHPPPPIPSPSSYRQQAKPQSLQRSHYTPQTVPHQQISPSQLMAQPPQEHFGQQYPPPRFPQTSPQQQQQPMRGLGMGNQKPLTLLPSHSAPGIRNTTTTVDAGGSGNQILSKRSIHELVNQIDPSEKLDPDVEDLLVELAEDFVDSITTFGCSFAKHRKSNTLEAKDIILHLEKEWHISLPGFGGEEVKTLKKLPSNDIHKERVAVIKKSSIVNEIANIKSSVGQIAGNAKNNAVAKEPSMTSPS